MRVCLATALRIITEIIWVPLSFFCHEEFDFNFCLVLIQKFSVLIFNFTVIFSHKLIGNLMLEKFFTYSYKYICVCVLRDQIWKEQIYISIHIYILVMVSCHSLDSTKNAMNGGFPVGNKNFFFLKKEN